MSQVRRHFVTDDPRIVRGILQDTGRHRKTRKRRPVFGRGIVTSEGKAWEAQRALARDFFNAALAERIKAVARSRTEEMLRDWARSGPERACRPEMSRLVLGIMGEALFGVDPRPWEDVFERALAVLLPPKPSTARLLWHRLSRGSSSPYVAALRDLEKLVDWLCRKAPPGSLTRHLADAAIEGIPLREQVSTYLLASTDTTATFLSWTMALWAWNPAAQQRSRTDSAYRDACLQESLRLFPPIWRMARRAEHADPALGIRKGEEVIFLPYLLHRHRDYWTEPDRFRPERFLSEAEAARGRPAFLPFGAGPRACPGAALSLRTGQIVTALVLHRFSWEPASGSFPVPEPLFTLRPHGGVPIRITARST